MIFSRRRDPAKAIAAFWAAWPDLRARAEASFAAQQPSEDLIRDVRARVDAIHPELEWEFSRGRAAQHAFIVSSGGNPKVRAVAHRWREAAVPADDVWEFHGARQAEPEMFEAAFEAQGHRAELSDLRYAFTLDEQRAEYDVIVYHPVFASMPEPNRLQLTFLSLDWLLGEQGVETWIGGIEAAVAEPAGAQPPQRLAEAVAELARRYDKETWAIIASDREGWTPPPGWKPRMATVQVPLKAARWPLLDTHVEVVVPFRHTDEGMPDDESLGALRDFEDRMRASLSDAVLIAHETMGGVRTFHLYADSTRFSAKAVEKHATTWHQGRAKVRTAADPAWEKVGHLRP